MSAACGCRLEQELRRQREYEVKLERQRRQEQEREEQHRKALEQREVWMLVAFPHLNFGLLFLGLVT